ncbi:MAG TPA: MarR family transcriptional regulator [Steroidobacteraceae bacterium]|jgi:DNA-binding MarR family transcriptional regulator
MNANPVGTLYLLKRAELAVRSCMEVALCEFGLTPTQFLMLFRLYRRNRVSAAELAREIGVRPQSIIEVIRPLERRHLLKREPSPEHRRILHTRLTPAGEKLLLEGLEVAARIERELLTGLTSEELTGFSETLARLWERAERHELYRGSIREAGSATSNPDERARDPAPARR